MSIYSVYARLVRRYIEQLYICECYCLIYSLSLSLYYTFLYIIVASFQGMDAIITPAVKAIMSKLVPAQEQGI